MKKYLFILTFFICQIAFAQTQIYTSTVSGTWSLFASPYIINQNITIQGSALLTIEPGVIVKFKPGTKLTIHGSMNATGLPNQEIIFEANDTTNWYQNNTTNGGWNGIHFLTFQGTGTDISYFNNCILKDVKYGYQTPVASCNALTVNRKMKVQNSKFYHNTTGSGIHNSEELFLLNSDNNKTIEINNCKFYDNFSILAMLKSNNNTSGISHIHDCEMNNNIGGSVFYGYYNNLTFEDNLLHHNQSKLDHSIIEISSGSATIRRNKIYFNTTESNAAIVCRAGYIDIDNNLICNNEQTNTTITSKMGGAGINISFNEMLAIWSETKYNVRNNIIANNFSHTNGGGINVYDANAVISNNSIVNNKANLTGRAIYINGNLSEVVMKNNLFQGHVDTLFGQDSLVNIQIDSANKITFDYNFIPAQFSKSVKSNSTYTLISDTSHNVIGSDAMMLSPTQNNAVTTSALNADFKIPSNSACADAGDLLGSNYLANDYLGNVRVVDSKIDIGAIESFIPASIINNNYILGLKIYPNPAGNQFTIELPSENCTVFIASIDGKIISKNSYANKIISINTNHLSEGNYLILVNKEGKFFREILSIRK